MKYTLWCGIIFVLGFTLTSGAWAQWSSDPSKNLALADRGHGNDQVQPKVRPLSNNGWFVSWFDANPNSPPPIGYDVFLQRLNPGGVEQFRHDGIRVADLGVSSTQDYGLDVDTKGDALLAFLDDREGSNQQVTAAKMNRLGKALWGSLGVQLTNDASFHGNPKIAGTSDGEIVVGWISDANVVLQKLDANGKPQWGSGVVLSESGANYGLADLRAADNGTVIVSWVRDTGFGSPRHILANKLSASGQLLWGTGHVQVFDGGSLQFGAFPGFILDGQGGAVFAWYSSSPSLQCFAQHILADGSEAFPHNGSVASKDITRVRVDPAVSYRAATDEVFLVWTEEDSGQALNGIYAQKFDAKGARKWGQQGVVIVPLGADQQIFARNVQIGSGALAFWVDQQSFGSATIQATRLNGRAKIMCPQFPVSSVSAGKAGLSAGIVPSGLAAVAWQDYRNGNSDIFIQNVNRDCSLGQRFPR